jgi:hypothetical protein
LDIYTAISLDTMRDQRIMSALLRGACSRGGIAHIHPHTHTHTHTCTHTHTHAHSYHGIVGHVEHFRGLLSFRVHCAVLVYPLDHAGHQVHRLPQERGRHREKEAKTERQVIYTADASERQQSHLFSCLQHGRKRWIAFQMRQVICAGRAPLTGRGSASQQSISTSVRCGI